MKKLLEEFKKFALKGNVIDMAVGTMIGAAFSSIVSSLVTDIMTPILALVLGDVDFSSLKLVLKENTADPTLSVTLNYGNFLQKCFDFLIIAVCIFAFVKLLNSAKEHAEELKKKVLKEEEEKKAEEPPKQSDEVILLTQIKEILEKQSK